MPKTFRLRVIAARFATLLAALACCSCGAPRQLAHLPLRRDVSAGLKVATYNIYFRTRDFKQTHEVLRKMDADVVALQEVPKECVRVFDGEMRRDYPYRYFSSGLGLLSRFPLRHPRFEHSRRGTNGFLVAEIEGPRERVQVANLHLDPLRLWTARDLARLPFQLRRQRDIQQEELNQAFAMLKPGIPTILAGDFNRVGHDGVERVMKRGFTDSFASVTKNPDTASTLRFTLLGIRLGRRIDYIFHDGTFRTDQSLVVPGCPSDHDGLVSKLVWR